jgi:hypothetical protein
MRQTAIRFLAATAMLLFLALSGPAAAENGQDILVVANRSVNAETISVADLRELFLKKRLHHSDGSKAIPVHAPDGSAVRQAFCARVLEMSPAEEARYWQSAKIRSGKAPPPVFGNTLRAIFNMKGSIGYVYRSQYKEGVVKILLEIPAG